MKHKERQWVRAALLMMGILVMVLLVSNCGPRPEAAKTVGLTEQGGGCGSSVGLNAGDTLEVALDGNPTTGYVWETDFVVPSVIKPVGDPEFKADSQQLGAGGSYTFRFQAVAEGQATLKLIYHRPFESQTAPLKICEVTVVVRKTEAPLHKGGSYANHRGAARRRGETRPRQRIL